MTSEELQPKQNRIVIGECRHCFDLGVIRVISVDLDHETLMLCDCIEGQKQTYRLARWEWKCAKVFTRERCPVSWFKPELMPADKVVSLDGRGRMRFAETIEHKINYWKAKIQIAEGYWRSLGDQK